MKIDDRLSNKRSLIKNQVMTTEFNATLDSCNKLLNELEPALRINAAARLFMEHCLGNETELSVSHLAPLINTVAEALTKDLDIEKRLDLGLKAVQTYLRVPVAEYFGETLIRQEFIDTQTRDEVLAIKPADKEFGSFLMEQGIITQDQRDIAIITQKRLMTIKEVYAKLIKIEGLEIDDLSIMDNLKEIVNHFLISTEELEKNLRESRRENIQQTLGRLKNIITETEASTNDVLKIVDKIFALSDEIEASLDRMKLKPEDKDNTIVPEIKNIKEKVEQLISYNMELNDSQGIQDRVGQQLTKTIPTIQAFHDQLMQVAKKLQLNMDVFEEENDLVQTGYGDADTKRMEKQSDVDDLLANLGL